MALPKRYMTEGKSLFRRLNIPPASSERDSGARREAHEGNAMNDELTPQPESAEEEAPAVTETATEEITSATEETIPTAETVQPAEAAEVPAQSAEDSSEDFAKMLEEKGAKPERTPRTGEKVTCTVVSVSSEWVFVSFGGKSEGAIARVEFADEGAETRDETGRPPVPAPGAELEAYVLAFRDGEIHLTTRLSRREQSRTAIYDAFVAGVPVEGRVAKVIKGGFEVRVSDFRAFCPLSQIDLRWPKEPEIHVGQIYPFKVVEYKDKGRNIIVSRRALLEAEMVTKRDEIKKKINLGEIVTGRVRNVQSFGAFVELGGVDGLIPVSEMAWERVEDPAKILTEGQEVTAKVIGVDWEKDRISLSLKALEGDPWSSVAERFPVGSKVKGTVARLTNFGAFVNLEPGIDGMIHISALGTEKRLKHPKEAINIGDEVEAEVVAVEPEKRRISLSMEYKLQEGLGSLPRTGEVIRGTVEKIVDFGVFLRLPSGHLGLIPNAEMNTKKGTDHGQMLRPKDEMDVKVLEIEENGRKIRLSVKALVRDRERQMQKEYETYKGSDTVSFGTFGDLLKASKEKS